MKKLNEARLSLSQRQGFLLLHASSSLLPISAAAAAVHGYTGACVVYSYTGVYTTSIPQGRAENQRIHISFVLLQEEDTKIGEEKPQKTPEERALLCRAAQGRLEI